MPLKLFKNNVLFLLIMTIGFIGQSQSKSVVTPLYNLDSKNDQKIIVGANQLGAYLPMLRHKKVGIVANQTSVIFKNKIDSLYEIGYNGSEELIQVRTNRSLRTHLVDSLLSHDINIKVVFSPEHGFRGTADAGEYVKDAKDEKTGISIISLYGTNKKPKLKGPDPMSAPSDDAVLLDVMLFDIQDVGARFYTYISTLHYVMEACAEANIPLIILDRPNPNGHYIDGPILEPSQQSYVGMHPIPVVHGMTIGEYAQMINGEGWLTNDIKCELTIIKCKYYHHQKSYQLPIKPSPNLPNDTSINLYPSLCFFEGTNVSVGRGTNNQFQVIGSPLLKNSKFPYEFVPSPNLGAKSPKHEGQICYGLSLESHPSLNALNLKWLITFYSESKKQHPEKAFFNSFFTKLAGTEALQKQIELGWSEDEIKESWRPGLENYRKTRAKYLLYD